MMGFVSSKFPILYYYAHKVAIQYNNCQYTSKPRCTMEVTDDTWSGFGMNTTLGCLDNSAAVSRAQKAEAAAAVVYSTRCSSRRGKGGK